MKFEICSNGCKENGRKSIDKDAPEYNR